MVISHTMISVLPGAKAADFFDFMINPLPEIYTRWLPDEHYKFHVVKRGIYGDKAPVGDLIYFDQNIGKKHRMKFHAIIKIAEKPDHILYQMRKYGINLPGYLELSFADTPEGLHLTETIRIGYGNVGKIFDPAIRLFYSKSFFSEMDGHHKREWACLAKILQS